MRSKLELLLIAPLLALAAPASVASAQSLVRRPYLQTPTPSSITVVWTTDVPTNSRVQYGTSPQSLGQTAVLGAAVTQHEVTLTGLAADTVYYYNVGTTGAVLAGDTTHHFRTAPVVGARKKFRAWIVGDTGYLASAPRDVRDAMLGFVGPYVPDLYLHVGDMAYNSGTTDEFTTKFFDNYASILRNTPVWPALGNHEGVSSDSATQIGPYYTAFVLPAGGQAGGLPSGTEAYYSFDYANVHFVVLDTYDSSRSPGGAMLTWLQQDLAATSQDWIVAYWHYPPYTRGSYNSDTEPTMIEVREGTVPILEAAGVDLVLAGHSHIYERSFLIDGAHDTPTTTQGHILNGGDGKPLGNGPYKKLAGNVAHDGTVYAVVGHGAYAGGTGDHPLMYFSEMESGSCLIDVQDNRLSMLNVRRDGVVTDRFSILKGPGLVVGAPDGGEHLHRGTPYSIRWGTSGNIPTVRLEYSTNDGASWTTITASTPNTGRYTWTVPQLDSTTALIRVSDAANAFVADESNAGFTIETTPQQVIYFGDYWTYDDRGIDQGTAWRAVSFDDSGWKAGYAELGFGDADEATILTKATPSYPSAYFRKVIPLSGAVTSATLRLIQDDGIIVWVNGTQVFSKFATSSAYADFATKASLDNEPARATIATSPFVVGSNVVAVMVKQSAAASTDLSFDLELSLTTATTPPPSGSSSSSSSASSSSSSSSVSSSSSSVSSSSSSSSTASTGTVTYGGGNATACVTFQRGLFGAVRDATVWQLSPTWNDSANESLYTGQQGTGGFREALLWFDLSSIPRESPVVSAVLTIDQGYKAVSTVIRVHEIFTPWAEATVTWNNLGSWDSLVSGSFTAASGSGARTVNLTDLVQDWVDGVPNHGMLLEENAVERTQLRSSEYVTASKRPKLEVCYLY